MDWPAWEPLYEQVLADFGFSRKADREAARVLDELLSGKRLAKDRELRRLFEDRQAIIAGPAMAKALPTEGALVACDAAVPLVAAHGRHPEAIVTDLDGAVEAQVKANACCSLAVIHAHGDNVAALRAWVPQFQGALLGTCQGEPLGALRNYGGFTDGDRACALAAHYGATKLVLVGWDFDHPVAKPGKDPAVKARKLAWARRLIDGLGVPVELR